MRANRGLSVESRTTELQYREDLKNFDGLVNISYELNIIMLKTLITYLDIVGLVFDIVSNADDVPRMWA